MGYFGVRLLSTPPYNCFFIFYSTRAFLPFDPCLKPFFFSSLFSVTCRCYKQILIATLPLVGSTSYTIKTSNTKPLGSSLLVWGIANCVPLCRFRIFLLRFLFSTLRDRPREGRRRQRLFPVFYLPVHFSPHTFFYC